MQTLVGKYAMPRKRPALRSSKKSIRGFACETQARPVDQNFFSAGWLFNVMP